MAALAQAVRSLLRAPGFAAAAMATFALGIGMNIAVFSVIDRMLFRPLPYAHRDRLVQLHLSASSSSATPQAFLPRIVTREIAAGARSIESIAFASAANARDDEALRLASGTYNLLSTVGARPLLGRDFTKDDAAAKERALLLTYDTWRRRFGADPEIVGTVVTDAGWTRRIVGVLPPDFLLPSTRYAERLDGLSVDFDDLRPQSGDTNGLMTAAPVARLRPGVTLAQAQAEVDLIVARVRADIVPSERELTSESGAGVTMQPLRRGLVFIFAPYLWLIATAVWLVLLIACVNLATLLLARGRSREHEAAIHTALGASFGRLATGALAETGMLCVGGAAVALVVCLVAQDALVAVVPPYFHGFVVSALDSRLVGLSLAAAIACAVVAGLVPALALRRLDVLSMLQRGRRGGGGGRLRGGTGLLAVEAAVGVVLVGGAAMTVRSFLGLLLASPGFEPANLYHLDVSHGFQREGAWYPRERVGAIEELVRAQPGVERVGSAVQLPVGRFAGRPSAALEPSGGGRQYPVGAGLFAALGTRILAGREFTEEEITVPAPVALVNQRAAAALWPGVPLQGVLGRTVDEAGATRTIVGVVADITRVPGEAGSPAVMVPLTDPKAQRSSSSLMIAVRMAPALVPDVRALDTALDARLGNGSVRVNAVLDSMTPFLQRPRFQAALFGALAAIALVLCAVGLYAVASFEVSRRRHEMGLRLALGATTRHLRRVVIRDAVRPVVLGVVAGTVAAFWAGQFLQAFLVGVDARDPWTLGLVVTVLIATAVAAAWLPARRASLVDPATTLRAQ